MTNILLAIDETDESKRAAEIAASCFGPEADYLAIYVDERLPVGGPVWGPTFGWGGVYTYPHFYPGMYRTTDPAKTTDQARGTSAPSREASAEAQARRFVAEAGVVAEPLGSVGDPATAIIDAAHQHDVDVIVVGTHHRNWFSKLWHGSTTDDVLSDADLPVLVVPTESS